MGCTPYVRPVKLHLLTSGKSLTKLGFDYVKTFLMSFCAISMIWKTFMEMNFGSKNAYFLLK